MSTCETGGVSVESGHETCVPDIADPMCLTCPNFTVHTCDEVGATCPVCGTAVNIEGEVDYKGDFHREKVECSAHIVSMVHSATYREFVD